MHESHERISRRARIAAVAALVIATLLAPPRAGATEPSSSRGFEADQLYHVNGIDTVNDFNGFLTVNIPIGPVFKTNGSLTYGFTLRYNSNFWDYRARTGGAVDDPKPRWSSGGGPTDVFP